MELPFGVPAASIFHRRSLGYVYFYTQCFNRVLNSYVGLYIIYKFQRNMYPLIVNI